MSELPKRGILRGLFVDSPDQIRRIMGGLSRNLRNPITDPLQPTLPNMLHAERTIATRILRAIRAQPDIPFLLKVILQFIRDVDGTDAQVIAAARVLENLLREEDFLNPQENLDALSVAMLKFDELPAVDVIPHDIHSLNLLAPGAFLGPDQVQPEVSRPWPKTQKRCERCISKGISCSKDQPACMECRYSFGGQKCHYPLVDEYKVFMTRDDIDEVAVKAREDSAETLFAEDDQPATKTNSLKSKTTLLGLDNEGEEDSQEGSFQDGKKRRICTTDRRSRPVSEYLFNKKTGRLYKTCIDCQRKMVDWQAKHNLSAQLVSKNLEGEETEGYETADEFESPEPPERKGSKRRINHTEGEDSHHSSKRTRGGRES